MAEKVFPIVRPTHFFFLASRSGNAWRLSPNPRERPLGKLDWLVGLTQLVVQENELCEVRLITTICGENPTCIHYKNIYKIDFI